METFLTTRDFAVSGEEFRLVRDPEFDMLITKPRPAEINRYYHSDSYISHTDSYKTLADKLYHAVKKYMLRKKIRLLEKYSGGPGKMLDIGAGTGEFLRMAKSRKWQIAGVEPNQTARRLAEQKEIPLFKDIDEVIGSD